MMNPREVRIGNLLEDREGRLCRVEYIDVVEFKAPAISGGMTALPNSPILLTWKWLQQFGFTQSPSFTRCKWLSINGKVNFYQIDDMYEDGWLFKCWHWELSKKVVYVHELQNLYFGLTGEDLKLEN